MGAYRGDDGKPFVLESVRKAEKLVLDKSLNHEYAGIAGKSSTSSVLVLQSACVLWKMFALL